MRFVRPSQSSLASSTAQLYHLNVIDRLSERVRAGAARYVGASARYIGASAGSNVACPSIRATNDMPICHPPHFDALGVVPFQINLHYVDADRRSTYMGETLVPATAAVHLGEAIRASRAASSTHGRPRCGLFDDYENCFSRNDCSELRMSL